MTLSRAALAGRAREREQRQRLAGAASRNLETVLLLAGSLVIATGLALVYAAKTKPLADYDRQAAAGQLLNINELTGPQQIVPYLKNIPGGADRDFIADRIYDAKRRGVRFDNAGAIARMRVDDDAIRRARGLESFPQRLAAVRERRQEREEARAESRGWLGRLSGRFSRAKPEREIAIPLLTPQQYAQLKPSLAARRPGQYRRQFFLWIALFFISFYAVHLLWRARGFAGDNLPFPIAHLLCGLGLILMISLRDPLRDTLMFADFAEGAMAGCAALFLFSLPDYERSFGRLSYVPLIASLLLAMALGVFGTGPGTSDAKVNLLFFQPVEIIRILLALFLAGYFARNWDALRQLRQKGGALANWPARFNVPRLDYVLPAAAGVAVSLVLFFWLSDLGPALVIGCLFLILYSVARKRALLACAGLAIIVLGFAIGHAIGYPRTVTERVNMWASPWDNSARGGDQLADSLWSLAAGALTGAGPGLGEPSLIPAAHTDLILSSLGEELGFLGLAAVFALYSLLLYRSLRIALNAAGAYSFFLVTGLALILALQILLIAAGLLGLAPLSGVVSPFLSYGRTSMVANFVVLGMILSISSRAVNQGQEANFGAPTRALTAVLAALALIVLARAAYVQVAKADDILARGTLVMQADGVRRYQYNPRLLAMERELPKGTIYDRNGLPLAASDWSRIEARQADYERLGVALDRAAAQRESRHYPLGPAMFYLLGDARSRLKQGATNTAFQENSSRIRLQGFDDVAEVEDGRVKRDYRALIPLLRHRYQPGDPEVKALLARPRDVRMSIDAALQLRASAILKNGLARLGKQKGALVIMDPKTGDLLAAVSYPWPSPSQFASLSAAPEAPLPDPDLLDRARFGLYPPGSSFKIVTAIAALRKDPALAQQRFECIRLPDGRAGNYVGRRAIRDDIADRPHGSVDLAKAITVSCNAYFAQLGAERVGAQALYDTAALLGLLVARPNTPAQLKQFLAQASYGQGQVVVSPFQMARVAAAIASGGSAPQGRWVLDETNVRVREPAALLPRELAKQIAGYMRAVVTSGTGRALSNAPLPIAGKTGTAEAPNGPSHAWFIGFAPYGGNSAKQIAFAVLVENGQYGGAAAAPIAGELVKAARELGIL